jgi:hypothetical protein
MLVDFPSIIFASLTLQVFIICKYFKVKILILQVGIIIILMIIITMYGLNIYLQ